MHSKTQAGQALTEFILVIPLFLVILLGVVQLSLIYLTYQVVHYASFAACRAAVVRPCETFHPDFSNRVFFTPTVFSAAVLSTMAVAPAQPLIGTQPYGWMPVLPDTDAITGLDFAQPPIGNVPENKYINATYLTAVQRVVPDYSTDPPDWEPLPPVSGEGAPCMDQDYLQTIPGQNVPPTGHDISLEVTFLYPMQVPLVNRVLFGIWVNFTDVALDLGVGAPPVTGVEGEGEVMVLPTYVLPTFVQYRNKVLLTILAVFDAYGYSSASKIVWGLLANQMNTRAWYPIPIRARTTLSVEGSIYPMVTHW